MSNISVFVHTSGTSMPGTLACNSYKHLRNRKAPAVHNGTHVLFPSAPVDRERCGHLGKNRTPRQAAKRAFRMRLPDEKHLSFKKFLKDR